MGCGCRCCCFGGDAGGGGGGGGGGDSWKLVVVAVDVACDAACFGRYFCN